MNDIPIYKKVENVKEKPIKKVNFSNEPKKQRGRPIKKHNHFDETSYMIDYGGPIYNRPVVQQPIIQSASIQPSLDEPSGGSVLKKALLQVGGYSHNENKQVKTREGMSQSVAIKNEPIVYQTPIQPIQPIQQPIQQYQPVQQRYQNMPEAVETFGYNLSHDFMKQF